MCECFLGAEPYTKRASLRQGSRAGARRRATGYAGSTGISSRAPRRLHDRLAVAGQSCFTSRPSGFTEEEFLAESETGGQRPGKTTLLVLPGDGIGPEIVAATIEVLQAADRQFKLGLVYETA